MSLARGLRNNNPGNIRKGIAWDGLKEDGDDEDFDVYVSPEMGIRAMTKIIITYNHRYGKTTVKEIITRWAPPVENDTKQYIALVCRWTGFTPKTEVDLDVPTLTRMVMAMARMECGKAHWAETVYSHGVQLALEV